MVRPEPAVQRQTTNHHTALLLVAAVDRRILPALHFVARLPYTTTRALHVSTDAEETRRLAVDWMNLGLTWLPLRIQDATAETLAASVRQAVQREADFSGSVTVVIPELEPYRWWRVLFHRRKARHIAQELQAVPGLATVLVPFSAAG